MELVRSLFALLCMFCCGISLQCLSNTGQPVGWWFIYKVNDGYKYAYYDNESNTNGLKVTTGQTLYQGNQSALERTLSQIYQNHNGTNWIAYNDEKPSGASSESCGHTKGVVGYDSLNSFKEGFWLIHSVPEFPDLSLPKYQFAKSNIHGQTMLCITFNSFSSIDTVGYQLRYMQPQVYQYHLVDTVADSGNIGKVVEKEWLSGKNTETLVSTDSSKFTHFTRSGDQNLDIMEDIISPSLSLDFVWETWRRSPEEPSYCPPAYKWMELNVNYVKFADGTTFKETQDHSKVGVSYKSGDYVCVGGLNRMTSQNARGGGYACFIRSGLYDSLNSAFVGVSYCNTSTDAAVATA